MDDEALAAITLLREALAPLANLPTREEERQERDAGGGRKSLWWGTFHIDDRVIREARAALDMTGE